LRAKLTIKEKNRAMTRKFWPGPPRPSTRAFIREARRTPGYSLFDWLHGYVYMRWPSLYISIGLGRHPLARVLGPLGRGLLRLFSLLATAGGSNKARLGPAARVAFANAYHGKVVPLEAARRLVSVKQEVSLTDLEQVIPYSLARDIILHNPDHIVLLECPCRASRPNPCRPLDVCLIVGEPFASFAAEHHPHRSRWITSDEAALILQAEHERGHVHHAFFKDAMLGRFYAICNCCACCCGAMQAWRNGIPMLASSGYISRVDEESCLGCGVCADLCQFGALSLSAGLAVVDAARCMGCGVCVSSCAQEALSLVRDPSRGEPLEIHKLVADIGSAGPV
jgi:ferredoxin